MAQPYNLTVLNSQNDLVGIMQSANILSGGMLGIVILLLSFITLFIAFKQYEIRRALASSSFITSIIAIFLRLMNMLNDQWLFGIFIITGISLIALIWGGD